MEGPQSPSRDRTNTATIMSRTPGFDLLLVLPALLVALAFFVMPMARLALVGASGEDGLGAYLSVLTNPRHGEVMLATLVLSAAVTATTLALGDRRRALPGAGALCGPGCSGRRADLSARLSGRGRRVPDHPPRRSTGVDRAGDRCVDGREAGLRLLHARALRRLSLLLHTARPPDRDGRRRDARSRPAGSRPLAGRRSLGHIARHNAPGP